MVGCLWQPKVQETPVPVIFGTSLEVFNEVLNVFPYILYILPCFCRMLYSFHRIFHSFIFSTSHNNQTRTAGLEY